MGDITMASTTQSQAELEHAASDNWREPFVPATETETASGEKPESVKQPAAEKSAKTASESGTEKTETQPKKKGGFQKSIDRLTREKYELQQQIEELRKGPGPQAAKPEAEPKVEDFKTIAEYEDAKIAYKVDQRIKAREIEETRKAQEDHVKSVLAEHNRRIAEAIEVHPDYEEVRDALGNTEIQAAAYFAIPEQPNSAEVVYYLGKNPDVVEELNRMSPTAAAARIGRISAMLERPQSPTTKPVSRISAPLRTVGGSAVPVATTPDKMSYREYDAWWKKTHPGKRA